MAEPNDDAPGTSSNEIETPPKESQGIPKRLRTARDAQDDIPPRAVAHTHPSRMERALERARIAARIADDNRGRDILLLDLRGATPLVDFFVIVTAASRRTANAIAIEIDAEMKKIDERKLGIEGSEEGRWILMDYGDFVVHVFNSEARQYYALEDVWGDAPQLEWRDPSKPGPAPKAEGEAPGGEE